MFCSDAMSEPSEALHFHGVTKRYQDAVVIADVELTVTAGSCTGVVGVNGAGKTTLIKCLLDFTRPDQGTITIFDRANTDYRAREALAYLPEQYQAPYYLRGRDLLQYLARMYDVTLSDAAVSAIFQELDLDKSALNLPVRKYSKGMGQKLGLAGCLLSGRRLLVLDEPMSGLDPRARVGVKKILRRLHQAGTTLFFSSHLLADVDELCDHLIILHDHEIQFQGSPQACREQFHAATLEQAYMNCIQEIKGSVVTQ